MINLLFIIILWIGTVIIIFAAFMLQTKLLKDARALQKITWDNYVDLVLKFNDVNAENDDLKKALNTAKGE